jgi:hypothetical protein
MKEYSNFEYLYPTRPKQAIMPEMLSFYEERKWLAQIKKNGTCVSVVVSPDKEIKFFTRHGPELVKRWDPTEEILNVFRELPKSWWVFAGELLHMKTPTLKNTLYLYDVMISNGNYLTGSFYAERMGILRGLWKSISSVRGINIISDHFWIADDIWMGFEKLFHILDAPEDEGLVLKDPNGKLEYCRNENANSKWQRKCRRPTKNYGY